MVNVNDEVSQKIRTDIAEIEKNLAQALDDAGHSRGAVQDAIKIVVPMVQDSIRLTHRVLALLENQIKANHSEMKSATDPRLFDNH